MRGIPSRPAARAAAAIAGLLAGFVVPVGAIARQSSPPPLSSDRSSADVASTFGSGSFGRWIVDRFGLPAYPYEWTSRSRGARDSRS